MQFPYTVEASLVAGANEEGRYGDKTMLMISAENGDQATRLLLYGGAGIEAMDHNQQTALHLAAAKGHAIMVRPLAHLGANKKATDNRRQTALHLAAGNNQESTVQCLLKPWVPTGGQSALLGKRHFMVQLREGVMPRSS
jgi:ankyrin repeat protein